MWPCSSLIGPDGQLEPIGTVGPSIEPDTDYRLSRWNLLEPLAAVLLLGAAVFLFLVP